jgi:hypothetical protein
MRERQDHQIQQNAGLDPRNEAYETWADMVHAHTGVRR